MKQQDLARALGWFSVGLGVAELLAPRKLEKAIGVKKKHNGLTRSYGLRELTAGIGLLTADSKKLSPWMWSRVAGDMLDLASLGSGFTSTRNDKRKLGFATAAVLGVTVADILCSMQLSEEEAGANRSIRRNVCIRKSPEELYQFWRNFENLPNFMLHLDSVQVTGGTRSHWVAKGPAGTKVEWDAEIVDDQPNHLISWQSMPGADVDNWGTIRFEPVQNRKETLVDVELGYAPPAGTMGALFAKLFGEAPEQTVKEDLRRFKQLMETGEISTTEGQPAGRATSATKYEKHIRSMVSA
jgi:uncharacterized membrane protein